MRRDYKAATRFKKFKIRDYRRRAGRYKNPLFSKKAEKISYLKRIKGRLIAIGVLAVVGVLFYFIFINYFFYISEVKVEGISTIDSLVFELLVDNFLKSRRLLVIPNQNILFSNVGGFKREVGDKYVLDELVIKRKLPNKLFITVNERTAIAILCTGSEYFYLDSQGVILRRLSHNEVYPGSEFGPFKQAPELNIVQFDLPYVYLESNEQVKVGENFLETQKFMQILGSNDDLTLYTPYTAKFYKIKDLASNWFKLATEQGFEIHISLDKSIQTQIVKFYTFVKEQGINPADYAYFNIRFEDRIYYQ